MPGASIVIKAKPKVTRRVVTVTPSPVTVTRPTVTKDAAKQAAYRQRIKDRKSMGGLTWEQFLAETVAADG